VFINVRKIALKPSVSLAMDRSGII
jgi:hypothetical protein